MKLLTLISLLSILLLCNCGAEDAIDELVITISGNISDDGQSVEGALIILVDNPNLTDGVSLANGSVSLANGNYTIVGVEEGNYYVVAVDDVNDNFQYDMGVDRFGFYGVDPSQLDILPDLVRVTGQDVADVDVVVLLESF